MKIPFRVLLCCAVVVALAASAVAQKPRRSAAAAWGVPQVFSSLSYGSESGDVGGMEVVLFPGDGHHWAVVMAAEGVPDTPQLVKAEVKGADVEFTLTGEGSYAGKFKGKISNAGLTLWWPSGESMGLLKRQRCG